MLLATSAPVDWLPEVALGPTPHAPEEVQAGAFVEDQVSIDEPPLVIGVGFAASDTVGTGDGVVLAVAPLECTSPAPPQAERPRPANRTTNAKSVLFDTTTPRLLVTPTFSVREQGGDRRNVLVSTG